MRFRGSLFAVCLGVLALASPIGAADDSAGRPTIVPNDPGWYWARSQRQIGMPEAWGITTGNPNVVIAVVDTGVEPNLPDLQGLLAPGWDFVDNDAVLEDRQGHGTMVATEIGAAGNNGQGIAGYCWRCRIMPVRVSSGGYFDMTLAAKGIRWAADHGARIISLSFSDSGNLANGDPEVAAAIADAASKNVLVVASAGNSGLSLPTYPAASPGAYAVGSADESDKLFWWSTFGPWVSLAAPGCQVMTMPVGESFTACGSSAAAPVVAGIAGLMLSLNPSLTPHQLISTMQRTSVPISGIGGGRVDAFRALQAIRESIAPPPQPPAAPPPPTAQPRPVTRPSTQPAAAKKPTAATHVERGMLARHRVVTVKVHGGNVAATLQSKKAKSCVVSLMSNSEVWVSRPARRGAIKVTVSAKVPAGRYKVDVRCTASRPSRFTLSIRAVFV